MDNNVIDVVPEITQAVVETAPSERLFKQAELNEIVGRAKHDAVESFKQRQLQNAQQPVSQQQQQPNGKTLSEDDVKRLTAAELERQREVWIKETQDQADKSAAERIVAAYKEKISPGKEKYQDFEAVTNNVDMRYYPNVVQLLAEHVDNSHDVLYDLAQHRTKLSQIEQLCGHNPQDAIYEIKRLAESIKANEVNNNSRTSKAPLSQQRPSNTGTDSGGTLSMRDLKAKYRA